MVKKTRVRRRTNRRRKTQRHQKKRLYKKQKYVGGALTIYVRDANTGAMESISHTDAAERIMIIY
jgi:hypothetical protein